MKQTQNDLSCIIEPTSLVGGLYLCNMETASDYYQLQQNQIRAILTVCPQTIPLQIRNKLAMYKQINVDDEDNSQISNYFEECYIFIEAARQRTNVIVHCQMGISRSATIIISYLVKKQLIGVREALKYVESKRSCIFPNNGFLKQLAKYERQIFVIKQEPQKKEISDFEERMQRLRESNRLQREQISNQIFTKYLQRRQENYPQQSKPTKYQNSYNNFQI